MNSMSTVPKGTMIIRPGDASRALFLLKRGRVRLFKVSPEGREFTLAILGDGNIFGETEGFSTVRRLPGCRPGRFPGRVSLATGNSAGRPPRWGSHGEKNQYPVPHAASSFHRCPQYATIMRA